MTKISCLYSFSFFSNVVASLSIVAFVYIAPEGLFGELIITAFVFDEIFFSKSVKSI